jgi:hypothetical protein
MDSDWSARRQLELARWVPAALVHLDTHTFADVDLDYLFDPPPVQAAMEALLCLPDALALGRETLGDVQGAAIIPIDGSSLELRTDFPPFEASLEQRWQYGPGLQVPTIYLLRPDAWHEATGAEEYRYPVSVSALLGSGFHGYYRCLRSSEDAARGWEYSRHFVVRSSF